ncbi:SubName: Full=Uncharacterized protein {ECO:0000313/EMBL:CCA69542.1} [Serendipita indica DSM 11827]|nr:SubName: Full=Uncharacterized protein {ECO:0000313/EMBL:CCA69542.1} [Serendipita indica DSM 11827]
MESVSPIEFTYACRQFRVMLRNTLNDIERKHEEFFRQKQAALLTEIEDIQSRTPMANRKRMNGPPVDTDLAENLRKKRLEALRQEFKIYSEDLYTAATTRLRSEALAIRTKALEHYRARMGDDEDSVQSLAETLDQVLAVSTLDRSNLFLNPLFYEGFCRLNPIDLTK